MASVRDTINKIVENLEDFTAVWDSNNPNYSNMNKKQAELSELAQLCGISTKELETKYTSLRTRFRKVCHSYYFLQFF